MAEIKLTPSQRTFQQVLTRATGLNSKVVGAWILAEMGGASSGAAQKREAAKNYNWLNIGYFDSGPGGLTKDKVFGDPVSAAKATAQFLKGERFGASSGIQKILNYRNASPQQQINAIATSGWASSGYNGGSSLRSLYNQAPGITPGVGAGLGGSSLPKLTAAKTPGALSSPGSTAGATKTITTTTPAVPASDNRKEVLAQYLLNRHDPSALLNAALAVKVDPGVPAKTETKTVNLPGSAATPKGSVALPKGTPANPSKTPSSGGSGGAANAVKWAQSTVGVAETGGANRGPRIDQWQQRFGLRGEYWCAMWTSLAATKGGMPRSGRTARVLDVYNAAAKGGNPAYQKGFIDPRKAKPGDLIVFGKDDHIGMVESNTGSGLVMIAGNDSNRVNRRTIAYGNGDIVRPKYKR